ncbi:MAG TPA: alpha/beta fold hydrolase [Longimicrobiaceae bacterium]|nr:alpha/beta fold hydrolase [Longimicrobiaceae bacterium]
MPVRRTAAQLVRLAVAASLAAACAGAVSQAPQAPPAGSLYVRGPVESITHRATATGILVQPTPGSGQSCGIQATADAQTRYLRRTGGGELRWAALSDVRVGDTVEVYVEGPVARSCPAQGRASAIVLVAGAARASSLTTAGTAAGVDTLPAGLRPGSHEAVAADGVRLRYRVAGNAPADAPPVVFLHGGPGQGSHGFAALVGPRLEPRLRMVYFDQRGSGRSDRAPNGDYSMPTLVEDVEALRRALGVPEIAIIGHSFGVTLGLEYAAKYPGRVSRAVLAAGLWDVPIQCALRAQRLAELRPEAYARVRGDTLREDGTRRSDCDLEFRAFRSREEHDAYTTELMFPDPAVAARVNAADTVGGLRNTGEIGRALGRSGFFDRYRFTGHQRITLPVLVIAGRHDGAARPEGLRELARRLPDARFLEYERSGHFMYVDEPDRFARDVIAFLGARDR